MSDAVPRREAWFAHRAQMRAVAQRADLVSLQTPDPPPAQVVRLLAAGEAGPCYFDAAALAAVRTRVPSRDVLLEYDCQARAFLVLVRHGEYTVSFVEALAAAVRVGAAGRIGRHAPIAEYATLVRSQVFAPIPLLELWLVRAALGGYAAAAFLEGIPVSEALASDPQAKAWQLPLATGRGVPLHDERSAYGRHLLESYQSLAAGQSDSGSVPRGRLLACAGGAPARWALLTSLRVSQDALRRAVQAPPPRVLHEHARYSAPFDALPLALPASRLALLGRAVVRALAALGSEPTSAQRAVALLRTGFLECPFDARLRTLWDAAGTDSRAVLREAAWAGVRLRQAEQ